MNVVQLNEVETKINLNDIWKITEDNRELASLLIICGHSGSGKTVAEKLFRLKYPSLFYKLPQVTTRNQRDDEIPGESSYFFVSKEVYNNMLDGFLIGNTFHSNNLYGTIPVFDQVRINTALLDAKAIANLVEVNNNLFKKSYYKLKINILNLYFKDLSLISKDGIRENRDLKFVENEKNKLFDLLNSKALQDSVDTIYHYYQDDKWFEPTNYFEVK